MNKKILSRNKSQLVNLYNTKIKLKALNNENYLSILEGIVEVICYGNNSTEIQGYIVDIMTLWVGYFSEAKTKSETNKALTEKELGQIVELINVLKSIIRAAYETLTYDCMVILTQIFKELWLGIKYFLLKYQLNHNIIESLMQLIKCFMRGIKSDFKPYLEDYISIIIQGYKAIPISSYLYGFEVLVTVFCNDKPSYQMLNNVFYELISCTFIKYIKSSNDLENNIDLGQDFFGLLCRMINLSPLLIFNSVLFDQLFTFTIMNIGISHIGMAKSIILFTSKIIKYNELPFFNEIDKNIITQLTIVITDKINKHSDDLMSELLNTLSQVPPQILVELLKELFFKCIQYFPQTTYDSFSKRLLILSSDCLTNKEKEVFLSYISNYNEKKLDNSIDKLINRCQSKYMRAANRENI